MSSFSIKYARPGSFDGRWEEIAQCLEPAIQNSAGRFSSDDVLTLVMQGKYHLLVVEDAAGEIVAALTAAVIGYPRLRVLEVSFLGGGGGLVWGTELLAVVENMAQITGCSKLEFRGRKEWGNVLRNDGYVAISTLYEKAISPCVTPSLGNGQAASSAH